MVLCEAAPTPSEARGSGRATREDLRSPADLPVRSASEASAEVGGGAEQYNLIISEFTSY